MSIKSKVPENPEVGQLYYDAVLGKKYKWNGKEWEEVRK